MAFDGLIKKTAVTFGDDVWLRDKRWMELPTFTVSGPVDNMFYVTYSP
jgi:hypothetical protein